MKKLAALVSLCAVVVLVGCSSYCTPPCCEQPCAAPCYKN